MNKNGFTFKKRRTSLGVFLEFTAESEGPIFLNEEVLQTALRFIRDELTEPPIGEETVVVTPPRSIPLHPHDASDGPPGVYRCRSCGASFEEAVDGRQCSDAYVASLTP